MSNDLVPITVANYPALAGGKDALAAIKFNLGGEQVSVSDLTRVKCPSGGGTAWMVPDAAGEEQPVKHLDGIILHVTPRTRAYWASSEPSGNPPDCRSDDCEYGIGEPGGGCEKCPFNQFGSAEKGSGKACKERRFIFLLREGDLLPIAISVPPASLKGLKMTLFKLGQPYYQLFCRVSLRKMVNKGGTDYAEVVLTKVGALPHDVAAGVLAYAQQLQALFTAVATTHESDVHETVEV
jgi:hypothetical protein